MSTTPPVPPDDTRHPAPPPAPPSFVPPPRPASTLTKLAIGFAVTIGVAFGLCVVSIGAGGNGRGGQFFGYIAVFSGIIEAACLVGLVVVVVIAIIRTILSLER